MRLKTAVLLKVETCPMLDMEEITHTHLQLQL